MAVKYKRGNPGVWGTAGRAPAAAPPQTQTVSPTVINGVPQSGRANQTGSGSSIALSQDLRTQLLNPYPQDNWSPGSDPYYQRVSSQVAAAREADAAQRRANIQQALIAFGMAPEGFNDQFGDIDQGTRDAMDKNTKSGISMYARLLDSKQQAKTGLLNRINAKGLFRSGAKGFGLKRGQLDFDRSLADSLAQLAQTTGQFSSSYANNEMARQNALSDAMARAYENYVPPTRSAPGVVTGTPTQKVVKTSPLPGLSKMGAGLNTLYEAGGYYGSK